MVMTILVLPSCRSVSSVESLKSNVESQEVHDTQLSTFDIQHSTKADTVRVVEYRDRVIEHPPEKYVPKFYKWCTIILWIILAAGIVYIATKWYIKLRT